MKLWILIICIALLSAAVMARDLERVAREERARRSARPRTEPATPLFTNADLERYERDRPPMDGRTHVTRLGPPRNLEKEEAYWRKQKLQHDRDVARVHARIRKLQSRLAERERAARRKGQQEWLRDDPTVTLLEESLQSLREELDRLDLDFRTRARKAGAFPGWIR